MAVHARFFVAEINKKAYGGGDPTGSVVLQASTKGEANKEWAAYTPSGRIEMSIRSEALAWFEARLGQDLAITFDEVSSEA